MSLKDYLVKTCQGDETITQRVRRFAGEISYSEAPVWKWLRGERPKSSTMELIQAVTRGKVKVGSWFKQ